MICEFCKKEHELYFACQEFRDAINSLVKKYEKPLSKKQAIRILSTKR